MNIARSIRVGLAVKNMAAQELAKKLGKTKQTISQWMNGKADPRLLEVELMAKIFNVKVSAFIAWGEG